MVYTVPFRRRVVYCEERGSSSQGISTAISPLLSWWMPPSPKLPSSAGPLTVPPDEGERNGRRKTAASTAAHAPAARGHALFLGGRSAFSRPPGSPESS